MTVPVSPVPGDAVPSDLWPGTIASARVPQPAGDQAAARQSRLAGHDFDGPATNAFVVSLPAEIDVTNALDACVLLCAAIDAGAGMVIADMSPTRFCDIAGLRMLVVASVMAADRRVQFRVVVPPGTAVLHTIDTMELGGVLSIYSTQQDAMGQSGN